MLEALDAGTVPDPAAFEARVRRAVADVVRQQVDAGIDVVNDGEQGKVGYSTYVRHRLTGFGGQSAVPPGPTGPISRSRRAAPSGARPSRARRATARSTGRTARRCRRTSPICARRVDAVQPTEAFMTAASPGVIAHFLPQRALSEPRGVPGAAGRRHEGGVRRDPSRRLRAPGRLPGPGHGPTPGLSRPQQREFVKIAEANVEALNHALRDIPADRCACTSAGATTRARTTATSRCARSSASRSRRRPQALSFEGANPRHEHEWAVFREVRLPDDRVIIPGVLDSTTNFIEHPELVAQRLVRYAEVVGRERVIAGTDCGFATFARSTCRSSPRSPGRRFGRWPRARGWPRPSSGADRRLYVGSA